MNKKSNYQSAQAYKESGLLSKWTEKLIIYDQLDKIMTYCDLKARTNKTLNLNNYDVRRLELYAGKWAIKFKIKPHLDVEPKIAKFGWNTQQELAQWFGYFSQPYVPMVRELDSELDRREPDCEQVVQVSVPVSMPKPSTISRMRQFIPEFMQVDFEMLLQNALSNLQGLQLSDHLTLVQQQDNYLIYQDPLNSLHMKLVYYSKMPAQRVFDEASMPSNVDDLKPLINQFQIYPTKKDCAVVMIELQKEVRMLYTQKTFVVDGVYCLIRKHTGQEVYHNQVDKSHRYNDFKLARSVVIIQQSQNPQYETSIIEEMYLECSDKQKGQDILTSMLQMVYNIDKILSNADATIKKQTENVIVKNQNNPEELQISFRYPEPMLRLLTSEEHQSKDQYEDVLNIARSGQHTLKAITNHSNQQIVHGLDKQLQSTPQDGHFLYGKYYEVEQKKGGLIFTNKKLMADQKRVIFDMVRRMGSNLLQGKSIMSVSLPIEVFESRSFLERIARGQGHAPLFLEQAAQISNPVEQLKLTMAFGMASFMMGIQQEKPFNPILGETFQGRILGCPIYMEQISHHPPISSYILYGRGYTLYGNSCPVVNLGTNSLSGDQQGQYIVHYHNTKLKFHYIWQPFTLYNITIGQRNLNCQKRCFGFQPDTQLVCCLNFNPKDENAGFFSRSSQKIDYVEGKLYKVTKDCIKQCLKAHKTCSGLTSKLKITAQDIIDTQANAQGRWTSCLEFDNKRYWDIEIHKPYILELEPNPLPSDSLYREDVLHMRMREQIAQEIKESMEVAQRRDNQNREKFNKQRKHAK